MIYERHLIRACAAEVIRSRGGSRAATRLERRQRCHAHRARRREMMLLPRQEACCEGGALLPRYAHVMMIIHRSCRDAATLRTRTRHVAR